MERRGYSGLHAAFVMHAERAVSVEHAENTLCNRQKTGYSGLLAACVDAVKHGKKRAQWTACFASEACRERVQ